MQLSGETWPDLRPPVDQMEKLPTLSPASLSFLAMALVPTSVMSVSSVLSRTNLSIYDAKRRILAASFARLTSFNGGRGYRLDPDTGTSEPWWLPAKEHREFRD